MHCVEDSTMGNGLSIILQTPVGKLADDVGSADQVGKGCSMLGRCNQQHFFRLELLIVSGVCGMCEQPFVLKISTP